MVGLPPKYGTSRPILYVEEGALLPGCCHPPSQKYKWAEWDCPPLVPSSPILVVTTHRSEYRSRGVMMMCKGCRHVGNAGNVSPSFTTPNSILCPRTCQSHSLKYCTEHKLVPLRSSPTLYSPMLPLPLQVLLHFIPTFGCTPTVRPSSKC